MSHINIEVDSRAHIEGRRRELFQSQNEFIEDLANMFRHGREVFYVVINPIDEKTAFCYSIYPC